MAKRKQQGPLSLLSPLATVRTYRRLRQDGTAATLDRLFVSRHVLDLRLIASASVFAAILVFVVAGVLEYATHRADIVRAEDSWGAIGQWAVAAQDFLIYVGPALAVCGFILAWVYQQGSMRLGIVDLFACEITTLCRVGTILDFAKQFIRDFDREPEATKGARRPKDGAVAFASAEEYFPIFDSNAKDLQVLEAKVVTHITSFYTYMKATRDSMRQLAQIPRRPGDDPKVGPWHTAKRNVVYMLFLAFESARKAVRDLVEYQPENAECTATILLTELACYGFLVEQFEPGEFRYRRLDLRREQYEKLLPSLCQEVDAADEDENPDWRKAKELIPELSERYAHVCSKRGGIPPSAVAAGTPRNGRAAGSFSRAKARPTNHSARRAESRAASRGNNGV